MRADGEVANHAGADRGGPLAGLVVVDLSRVLSGPYAAMILGDLGARVVKVERPDVGDDTRAWGPPFVGGGSARESTYYLSANRNKESVTLDLKDPGDRLALIELVRVADVLIENFRPGVLERLGLSDEELHEFNPRLVILSITGFGHDGPESTRAGYDQVVQGESGLMSLTGPEPGQPIKMGVPISDLLAGIFGVAGVLAALYERERSGRGDVVRTSLLASSVAVQTFQATRWLIAGEVPEPEGNQHPTVAPYGAFACRGEHLQLAVGNDFIWRRFAGLLELDPDEEQFSTNEQRVANRKALTLLIETRLTERCVGEWLALFDEHGIPAGRVKTLDQVYADPQVHSQGLLLEVAHPTLGTLRLPGPPLRFDRAEPVTHLAPPRLGEHNDGFRRWLADVGAPLAEQVLS
ncbi:MAG: CaiB/BaiF CoA transferase family protein [Acidimicrobiales bacterium]